MADRACVLTSSQASLHDAAETIGVCLSPLSLEGEAATIRQVGGRTPGSKAGGTSLQERHGQ